MKRLVATVVLVLLCSLLAPLTASAEFGDSARGSGETVFAERFSFTAEGFGPTGSVDATGTWKHTRTKQGPLAPFTMEGRVQCLRVLGNQATLAGPVTKSSNPEFVGRTFIVTVEDNNGAGEDRYGFVTITTFFTGAACLTVQTTDPIVRGNIEVVESTFPS